MRNYVVVGDHVIIAARTPWPEPEPVALGAPMLLPQSRQLVKGVVIVAPETDEQESESGEEVSFIAADPMDKIASSMGAALGQLGKGFRPEAVTVKAGDVVLCVPYGALLPGEDNLYLIRSMDIVALVREDES